LVFFIRFWAILIGLLGIVDNYAQGDHIDFKPGTFEETISLLHASDRLIFVTATADWCEVCKLMEQSVFTDQRVTSYYNSNFYNLKLNIEKGTGPLFAARYGIDTLPSMLFLTTDGTLLSKAVGYKKAAELIALGQDASKPKRLTAALISRYDEGDRNPDFLIHYLSQVKPANENDIILDYLKDRKQWKDEYTLRLLWRLPDSILTNHLDFIANEKVRISQATGKEEFDSKLNNLIHQKLFCTLPAVDIAQAARLIDRFALPNAEAIHAGYQLFYYTDIKKDINGYVRAQLALWKVSPNIQPIKFINEFNTIIGLKPTLPVFKEIHAWLKQQPLLKSYPESWYLLAKLSHLQGQSRKALRWLKRSERMDQDHRLAGAIAELRHTIRS
jgi:thioredoxin-related protein